MKVCLSLLLVFALALLAPARGQNPDPGSAQEPPSELPAAPSSVKVPPPPPPAPKPQPAPADPAGAGDDDEEDEEAEDDEADLGDAQAESERPASPRPSRPAAGAALPAAGAVVAEGDDQFRVVRRVDEVNVVFTVTDRRGRFVKDLTREDIQVLDDEKPPAAIVNFTRETDLPLRVGLLVDASNSIRDRFRFQQEAAIEFFHQVLRRGYDQAFVLGFDATAEVTQDFTDDVNALSDGLRMLRPGGGTGLYDAIYFACRDKLMNAAESNARRAIVLLSDGDDNQSRVTREETIEMALRAEVVIYAISTNISGVKSRGDKVMERLAEATGGRAFFPFKLRDVANALEDIQTELRSQYAVAYRPADFQPDGSFRSIEIVTENKRLNVRARKGYYAPRQ